MTVSQTDIMSAYLRVDSRVDKKVDVMADVTAIVMVGWMVELWVGKTVAQLENVTELRLGNMTEYAMVESWVNQMVDSMATSRAR